jgi:regulatory protein YycH of two-component signal transduction system YycFG
VEWINRLKTISLAILVISSVVLTAVLWYSTPSYDEQNVDYIPPAYVAKDNYVPKNLHQLTAPPYLISHTNGKHQLVTQQQSPLFSLLIRDVYGIKMDDFELKTPTTDDWNLLFLQSDGLELSYLQDMPVDQLDVFFYHYLKNESLFQNLSSISRVWIFEHPTSKKTTIWFISDQDGKVIQANASFIGSDWLTNLDTLKRTPNLIKVEAVPTNNKNPWDKMNQNVPFSRILYMPTQGIPINQPTYKKQTISIDSMKQWLLEADEIEPIDLSKNESVFMNNNQILTFYKQQSYMVYVDNAKTDATVADPVSKEIDTINTKFMLKHHGWTGNFVLEKMENQDNSHLYTFRLINQALPVYWEDDNTKSQHLDTIQLQAGASINAVSKYIRSLNYLSEKPTKQTTVTLPGKDDILLELVKKKIPLSSIKRIYPIYQASNSGRGAVLLTPSWQVEKTNGETIQIGGGS